MGALHITYKMFFEFNIYVYVCVCICVKKSQMKIQMISNHYIKTIAFPTKSTRKNSNRRWRQPNENDI